ncbi:MAG TPA: glycosyltransferase [Armatimonadota bacterium]|nr:glycosyltransferase [Armatimonadota bacterium]
MQFDIVCHCHLRWDFVWQRPQQLMTRMARCHRVFFLEDAAPLPEGEDTPRLAISHPQDRLVVVRPLLRRHTGDAEHDAEVDRENAKAFVPMVRAALEAHHFHTIVHWFYTPMAYWLANEIPYIGIVYDCMDELALFKNPPPGIVEREQELLDCANVVFTGGRSLYLGKVERHANVHMFASGVEVDHFGEACLPETLVPDDIASINRPRFTYTGVIDERLDLELIGAVARERPDWSFVMIGPVVKIEESALPHAPNIHYLGQKPYAKLPQYLKGSDVAIMPFALNDATRFISPTKTLEYMAARRPVVSTPIADVVAYYNRIVWVASGGASAFVSACEAALHPDAARLDEGVAVARGQTWDSIVDRMNALLEETLSQQCVIRDSVSEHDPNTKEWRE